MSPVGVLCAFVMLLLPRALAAPLVVPADVVRSRDMHASRAAHTATALPDGRVLIAGGFTAKDGAAHAAELYAPSLDRAVPLRMHEPRHSHTATILPDGRVLITGGYGDGGEVTASAELFDPRTQRFEPAGALTAPRAGHVAVPLRDGRVLLMGGVGPGWRFLASAEVYDPREKRFARVGDMHEPRESHVAVALADGRILVIGGHTGRRADLRLHASTELYDPVRQVFVRGASMRTPRHKHDALRLRDGRVLVLGGSDERDDRGAYTSTEVYDAARGTFDVGPRMIVPRYKLAGTSVLLTDGRVLVAGGHAHAELFDPVAGRFEAIDGRAELAGQFSATAPLRDGRVLITGGYGNGTGPRASTWLFRPDAR